MTTRPPTRVAYDVTALLAGDTGVARYVRELGAAVERLDVVLVPFAIGRGAHRAALPGTTRTTRLPLRLVHRAWSLAGRPRLDRLAPRCDLVHAPDLVPPPSRAPVVVTVHDLVALEHPDLHPARSAAVQSQQLAAARDRAAIVLTVSAATAAALRARGVDADRIVVAPNGVTKLPAPDASIVPPAPFLLAVGSLTPRKGFETLVAAFAQAKLPPETRLVLAGPAGWRSETVREAIDEHGLAGRITCTGRVTDGQLAALYASCTAVCVPSVAEGFGLPILEAATAGVPVIASDLPVFHEVADTAAQYAAVGDASAWAVALERIVGDTARRGELVERGRRVAQGYTWDRTARITAEAYERARQAA